MISYTATQSQPGSCGAVSGIWGLHLTGITILGLTGLYIGWEYLTSDALWVHAASWKFRHFSKDAG